MAGQDHSLRTVAPTEDGTPAVFYDRFLKLRPHASGGLGKIYIAKDREVPREVALKELHAERADDPKSRDRFLYEAQITGVLEHPGIAPVYGLGQYADGRPYYAMKFIKGVTLEDEITRFHRTVGSQATAESNGPHTNGKPVGGRRLLRDNLLRRFIDICNVIEYAHGRGVIHRDIKPQNMMLGKHGETVLIDWGLAKASHDFCDEEEEETLSVDKEISVDMVVKSMVGTIYGVSMGTPVYMSPEQAVGRNELVGTHSDIYSLGATLYQILTGKPPFAAAFEALANAHPEARKNAVAHVLSEVKQGNFARPRSINPRVPRPLESVCLKAMSRDIPDRYASAAALAADVELFLADEPVTAHAETWLEKSARWTRRHRKFVFGTGLFLVVTTLIVTMALFYVSQAKRTAENARQDATLMLQVARESVEELLARVSEDLKGVAGAQQVREQLLNKAAQASRSLAGIETDDPQLNFEAARMRFRLGEMRRVLDELPEAENELKRALNQFESLAADDVPQRAYWIAATATELGRVLALAGRTGDALPLHSKAHQLLEQLMAGKPKEVRIRAKLVETQINWADALYYQQRDEAVKKYESAFVKLDQLDHAGPEVSLDQDIYRVDLLLLIGRAHNNLGSALSDAQGIATSDVGTPSKSAEDHFRSGLAIAEKLLSELPEHPDCIDLAARLSANLAHLYRQVAEAQGDANKLAEALTICRRWLPDQERLVEDNPKVSAYREGLINSYMVLGLIHESSGELPKALDAYQRAVDTGKEFPDAELAANPRFHETLATAHYALGIVQYSSMMYLDARKTLENALQHSDAARRAELAGLPHANELDSRRIRVHCFLVYEDPGEALREFDSYRSLWPTSMPPESWLFDAQLLGETATIADKKGNQALATDAMKELVKLLEAVGTFDEEQRKQLAEIDSFELIRTHEEFGPDFRALIGLTDAPSTGADE